MADLIRIVESQVRVQDGPTRVKIGIGGPATPPSLYVQETQPEPLDEEWVWYQTDGGGNLIAVWVNDL